MKGTITTIILMLINGFCSLHSQGINFIQGQNMQQVLATAKAQNKLVFIHCYTSWCGPCKRLEASVFTDEGIGSYFNSTFVNAKFDMEKGEGTALAEKYSIRAYPTLLWIDGNGTVMHKILGGLDVPGLMQQGQKAHTVGLSFGIGATSKEATFNQSLPEFRWETLLADYGMIKKGDEARSWMEFRFKNVGTAPLIISGCRSNCGCMVPSCPAEPILPGGNGKIIVHYDVNRVGPFSKTITVTSNARNSNEIINLTGNVIDDGAVSSNSAQFQQNSDAVNNAELVEPLKPAILTVTDVKFSDENRNDAIDGNENCEICFNIRNNGKGASQNLKATATNVSGVKGLTIEGTYIGSVEPNAVKKVCVKLSSNANLVTGTSLIKISFEEKNGFQPDAFDLSVQTREFLKPEITISDYSFTSENGTVRLGLPVQLKALVQNIGQGVANNVKVQFNYPYQNVFPNGETHFNLGILKSGEKKELVFEFIANKLYTSKDIPINIKCTEDYGLYGEEKNVSAAVNLALSSNTITVAGNAIAIEKNIVERASLSADVDKNIPISALKKPNAYALVIGNEDYTRYQTGLSSEVNVEFARNDANTFAQYAEKTLGIPAENIILLTDAIGSKMRAELERIVKMAGLSNGEVYFYYAGHGLPDELTKVPYLIPVDIAGTDIQSAIRLSEVYNKLATPGIKRATVFLDACFSGGARNQGLVAARGVKVVPKTDVLPANLVVFAAASGSQMASPYREKQHGMFTYYLLKKLQDSKADITLSDLNDYLKQEVELQSLKVNRTEQSPNIVAGAAFIEVLKKQKVK